MRTLVYVNRFLPINKGAHADHFPAAVPLPITHSMVASVSNGQPVDFQKGCSCPTGSPNTVPVKTATRPFWKALVKSTGSVPAYRWIPAFCFGLTTCRQYRLACALSYVERIVRLRQGKVRPDESYSLGQLPATSTVSRAGNGNGTALRPRAGIRAGR